MLRIRVSPGRLLHAYYRLMAHTAILDEVLRLTETELQEKLSTLLDSCGLVRPRPTHMETTT